MADTQLKERLDKIWQQPNLFDFFEKYSKKPPHLVKKGTVLFNAGDPLSGVYFIKSGFVKLFRMSDEGKETTIYLTGPGNLLGLRALMSEDGCAHHFAEAITNCEVINMTREEYFDILSTNPVYIVDLLHSFIERLDHAEGRVDGFITTDTTARIANFLLDIAKRFGIKEEHYIVLPLPLTHQRIAEFVGAFRETVTLSLHELEKRKLIKSERSQITILDLKKLEEAAM